MWRTWRERQLSPKGHCSTSILSLLLFIMMMEFKECSIISWNIKGAMSIKNKGNIQNFVSKFIPGIFIVMETHT